MKPNKFEYSSPVREFTKKDEKNVSLSRPLIIGVVFLFFAVFFLEIPEKDQLALKTGSVTKIYQTDQMCGRYSKCTFININNTKYLTRLNKLQGVDIKLGDYLKVLAKYEENKDAYNIYELYKNEVLIKSYNESLINNNLLRIISGFLGLFLIVFSLLKREKI